jgi:hypothetical protein
MAFGMLYLELVLELEIFQIFMRNFWNLLEKWLKKLSKSVWVEPRRFKFHMNMKHQTTYSDLEFIEICLRVFLKNSEIF